jgi:hypothetical protein
MGFVLSVLYFITYYLTPKMMFGPLAEYRVELILALLVLILSLPKLPDSILRRTPQSVALIGLTFAVLMSVLIGEHWAGGGLDALLGFIPSGIAYFLVCLHCTTRKRLQILVLGLLCVCLFVIVHGWIDMQGGPPTGQTLQANSGQTLQTESGEANTYFMAVRNDAGEWFYRLRGLGEINDPNDFAQLVVCVIPLVFIFWRKNRFFRNIAFVILPVCVLLYGAYLTHSRGSLLAILAMLAVAASRRIGVLPALVLAAGMFAAGMALNFTGGRDISADAGSDRTALWGIGLGLLRSHPFFGVGFGNFDDYAGLTAHNSLVVCAAELGLLGLYFWSMFLYPTLRDTLTVASQKRVSEAGPLVPTKTPSPLTSSFSPPAVGMIEEIDKTEITRLGRIVLLSLTGFLVTGWFLSRAFVMTLFLLGGVAEVVFEMALKRGMVPSRLSVVRVMRDTSALAVAAILLLYALLRTLHYVH